MCAITSYSKTVYRAFTPTTLLVQLPLRFTPVTNAQVVWRTQSRDETRAGGGYEDETSVQSFHSYTDGEALQQSILAFVMALK